MKKALVSTVLSGLAISQANAEFYTYFAWSQMSQSQKNGYIAGIIDSYLTFSVSYRSAADHFSSCIIRLELTDGQLATGIGAFAESASRTRQANAVCRAGLPD